MNKANIFMTSGWVGLGSVFAFLIAVIALPDSGFDKPAALIAVLACWVMLFTRNADEYTLGLWASAASFAFAAVLILFLGAPFAEGFIDGVRESIEDREIDYYKREVTAEMIIGLAILAFYVGLFWKRLKGGV